MIKKHKMHKNKSKMNNMDKITVVIVTREIQHNYDDQVQINSYH